MGKAINTVYAILLGKDHMGDIRVNGRVILKLILSKQVINM
jgi:hypothetical protein